MTVADAHGRGRPLPRRRPMAYPGLDTSLTDHLAGATAGLNLVQLAAKEHQGDEHGEFFSQLAIEIREDYETLEKVMEGLAVEESAIKTAAAEVRSEEHTSELQ